MTSSTLVSQSSVRLGKRERAAKRMVLASASAVQARSQAVTGPRIRTSDIMPRLKRRFPVLATNQLSIKPGAPSSRAMNAHKWTRREKSALEKKWLIEVP